MTNMSWYNATATNSRTRDGVSLTPGQNLVPALADVTTNTRSVIWLCCYITCGRLSHFAELPLEPQMALYNCFSHMQWRSPTPVNTLWKSSGVVFRAIALCWLPGNFTVRARLEEVAASGQEQVGHITPWCHAMKGIFLEKGSESMNFTKCWAKRFQLDNSLVFFQSYLVFLSYLSKDWLYELMTCLSFFINVLRFIRVSSLTLDPLTQCDMHQTADTIHMTLLLMSPSSNSCFHRLSTATISFTHCLQCLKLMHFPWNSEPSLKFICSGAIMWYKSQHLIFKKKKQVHAKCVWFMTCTDTLWRMDVIGLQPKVQNAAHVSEKVQPTKNCHDLPGSLNYIQLQARQQLQLFRQDVCLCPHSSVLTEGETVSITLCTCKWKAREKSLVELQVAERCRQHSSPQATAFSTACKILHHCIKTSSFDSRHVAN